MSDAAAEFWRFSLAIYGYPDVPPACLVLQDQYGRDVNVALFCCWLGASGRGLVTAAALAAADQRVSAWRHKVVENFRAARRAVKEAALPETDAFYVKAKAIELEAEKLLQRQLVETAPLVAGSRATLQRLKDALANLGALYRRRAGRADPRGAACYGRERFSRDSDLAWWRNALAHLAVGFAPAFDVAGIEAEQVEHAADRLWSITSSSVFGRLA